MNPKTCHFVKLGNTYLGVPPRNAPARIFGFLRAQDAHLMKQSLTHTPFIIQQTNPHHYVFTFPKQPKSNPFPNKKIKIHPFGDIMTSAFFTRVNNVDLVLVDEVQKQANQLHLFSNYELDIEVSPEVSKEHFRRLLHKQPILYKQVLADILSEDLQDEEDDY